LHPETARYLTQGKYPLFEKNQQIKKPVYVLAGGLQAMPKGKPKGNPGEN